VVPGSPSFQGSRASGVKQLSSCKLRLLRRMRRSGPVRLAPSRKPSQERTSERWGWRERVERAPTFWGRAMRKFLCFSPPPIGGLGYANFSADALSSPALLPHSSPARSRSRGKKRSRGSSRRTRPSGALPRHATLTSRPSPLRVQGQVDELVKGALALRFSREGV
jgi:hypothetical protein